MWHRILKNQTIVKVAPPQYAEFGYTFVSKHPTAFQSSLDRFPNDNASAPRQFTEAESHKLAHKLSDLYNPCIPVIRPGACSMSAGTVAVANIRRALRTCRWRWQTGRRSLQSCAAPRIMKARRETRAMSTTVRCCYVYLGFLNIYIYLLLFSDVWQTWKCII